jgi:unconventional prefoldin RPB5 interactor 1
METQIDNLERLRLSLEANIAKLRTSLKYWQTWEYEHEGLKEELERPDHEPSSDEMLAIGTDLELDIVDEKEIKSLLNYGRQPPRTRSQVIGQLRGRIETGRKNAETMLKQLDAAEEKLEKVLMVAEPIMESEGGEQLMDIFEELDDDGNIISSRVVDASEDREKIRHVLHSNGLAEEEEGEMPASQQADKPEKDGAKTTTPLPLSAPAVAKEKKVAFAQSVRGSEMLQAPPATKMHSTQRMLIVDEHDNVVDSKPLELVHAKTATDHDDGMDYLREARANAQEIAPIVASFDIDEDSDSDMDADMDDVDTDGSENEFGMGNIGAELTNDYKSQMEALMQKHAVAMENAGPSFDPYVVQKLENAHREGGLIAKQRVEEVEQKPKVTNGSKGVRFAEELDISPALTNGKPTVSQDQHASMSERTVNPVAEAVLERGSGASQGESRTSTTRKPSRFKTTKNTTTNRSTDGDAADQKAHSSATIPEIATHQNTALPERPKRVSRFKASQTGP